MLLVHVHERLGGATIPAAPPTDMGAGAPEGAVVVALPQLGSTWARNTTMFCRKEAITAITATETFQKDLAGTSRRRGLNTRLWVSQGFLAAVFLLSGMMKLTIPTEQLQVWMAWIGGSMGKLVRFIGTVEVLGALTATRSATTS